MCTRKASVGILVVIGALVSQVAVAAPAPVKSKGGVNLQIAARLRSQLAASRKLQIARLKAYAAARAYPLNSYSDLKINVLIDEDGTICAAANLMTKGGLGALVKKTAKQNNFLRFADVKSGPLMAWMLRSGLTQEEIAVIQEPYMPDRGEQQRIGEEQRLHTHFLQTIDALEKNTKASLDIAVLRLLSA